MDERGRAINSVGLFPPSQEDVKEKLDMSSLRGTR